MIPRIEPEHTILFSLSSFGQLPNVFFPWWKKKHPSTALRMIKAVEQMTVFRNPNRKVPSTAIKLLWAGPAKPAERWRLPWLFLWYFLLCQDKRKYRLHSMQVRNWFSLDSLNLTTSDVFTKQSCSNSMLFFFPWWKKNHPSISLRTSRLYNKWLKFVFTRYS